MDRIYCAPGNAGIAQIAELVPLGVDQFDALADFAGQHDVGLTIVGMDDPLVGVDKSEAYRIDVREGYVAYSFNHVPSGRRYFVTVADADEAGFVYVCVYNQEAVEGDFLGEEDANIINEVWL